MSRCSQSSSIGSCSAWWLMRWVLRNGLPWRLPVRPCAGTRTCQRGGSNASLAPIVSNETSRDRVTPVDERDYRRWSSDPRRGPMRPCATRLLDSRQRWRDLVTMGADLAYETDEWGRFVFWHSRTLAGLADRHADRASRPSCCSPVGQRPTRSIRFVSQRLCAAGEHGSAGPTAASPCSRSQPHRCSTPRRALWEPAASAWTGPSTTDARGRVATALCRGEVLDHILWRMGQEVLAPRMMQAVLGALMNALGAEGAAVINLHGEDGAALVHRAGGGAEEVYAQGHCSAAPGGRAGGCHWRRWQAHRGRCLPHADGCARRTGALALPGSRGWDHEDKLLISAAARLICMVLEHEAIQQEMGRQARTDPLTGLLNRRAFLEEMARRIDRLDRDDQPGTLMFADLDDFKPVNDRLGHEAGDQVLLRTATILRDTLRPSDLVARLGGDEFALWMDGADHMTAAERAEHLCAAVPEILREFADGGGALPTVVHRHRNPRGRQW